MEYKEYIHTVIDNFYEHLQTVKDEVNKGDDGSFYLSIANLKKSRSCIAAIENAVNEMKQEEHDLTQDVYNKFKDKGYVKNISFIEK